MGTASSTILKKQLAGPLSEQVRAYGHHNLGNTCYCNAVLQAIFALEPFQEELVAKHFHGRRETPGWQKRLERHAQTMAKRAEERRQRARRRVARRGGGDGGPSLGGAGGPGAPADPASDAPDVLDTLAWLFARRARSAKREGLLSPQTFVETYRIYNPAFEGSEQHDAHEFLNFVLSLLLEREQKRVRPPASPYDFAWQEAPTWVNALFGGQVTTELRSVAAETISRRQESCLDLTLDIQPFTSVTHSFVLYEAPETLAGSDKYFCETMQAYVEGKRSTRITALPPLLILHLKRFQYVSTTRSFTKQTARVTFPDELGLTNPSIRNKPGSSAHPDPPPTQQRLSPIRRYRLVSVIVHIGSSAGGGHYIAFARVPGGSWLLYDDTTVRALSPGELYRSYGPHLRPRGSFTGYILFYQAMRDDPEACNYVTASDALLAGDPAGPNPDTYPPTRTPHQQVSAPFTAPPLRDLLAEPQWLH